MELYHSEQIGKVNPLARVLDRRAWSKTDIEQLRIEGISVA